MEVASQLFSGASSGDLRFIVRGGSDRFQFRAGPSGNEQEVAEIDGDGKITAAELEVSGTISAEQIDTPTKVATKELAASGKVTVGELEATNTVTAVGRVVAGSGLAVGNSARAKKPGRVVRRIAVFDEAGERLGFLPIYDRIGR